MIKKRFVLLFSLALTLTLLMALPANATEDFDKLKAAIEAANRGNVTGIVLLTADITLGAALPRIRGEVTIDGNGYRISGNENHRIFDVSGGTLSLKRLTLTQGKAEDGGAIRLTNGGVLSVNHVAFVDNRATAGGAIWKDGPSNRLIVESSSFKDNRAERFGGAIYFFRSTITISRSSFVGNRSLENGGAVDGQNGVVKVENSTFHANRAPTLGGAFSIYNTDLTLTHVTMTNNSTTFGESDAINNHVGRVTLLNSIVSNPGPRADCAGGFVQNAGNFSRDGTCGFIAASDPMLDELAGSPAHRSPLEHSPVIDAADPRFCLETDQLGNTRPIGAGCDIGAIETTAAPAPPAIEPPPACPLALRIVAANTDAPAGDCPAGSGHDVISLFDDIVLTSSLPVITSDITIEGNGHSISGDGKYRIFRVNAGKLTINNLALVRGFSAGLNSAGAAVGLDGTGQLEVNHSTFIDNEAAEGGAIGTKYNDVRFTVNNSHFEGNIASFIGGAISMNGGGRGTVTNSSFVEESLRARGRGHLHGYPAASASATAPFPGIGLETAARRSVSKTPRLP